MFRPSLRISVALSLALAALPAVAQDPGAPDVLPAPPAVAASSWLLLEYASGQVLAAQDSGRRVAPASLTKLMTAYLAFKAIDDGELSLTADLPVSAAATAARGSRMFAAAGSRVPVDALLRGLIVHSGNDAALVLAEGIAGSEAAFVVRMNAQAAELGLRATRFANATGWSAADHYSTAADLAALAAALIRDFPAHYARYFAEKRFTHGRVTQLNRNRLLWIDPTVDGVKSGFTEEAGWCLIASGKRGERRLLAVVLGAESDDHRVREALHLLNWGYTRYDALPLYAAGAEVARLRLWYGAEETVGVGFPDRGLVVAVPRGMRDELRAQLVARQPLQAPVSKGQPLGHLRFTLGGQPWGEYPVYSLKTVPTAGILGRAIDAIRLWLQAGEPQAQGELAK